VDPSNTLRSLPPTATAPSFTARSGSIGNTVMPPEFVKKNEKSSVFAVHWSRAVAASNA
jgi:hypothetical protein